MADRETVLAWADEVCAAALDEARKGDTTLANQIGGNPAMKHYFDNVHTTKAVKRDAFAAYYPGHFQGLTRLYEDYERDLATEAAVDQVGTLAESLAELKALVEAQAAELASLKAEKAEVVEPVEPVKSSKKAAKSDAAPEADAESEA